MKFLLPMAWTSSFNALHPHPTKLSPHLWLFSLHVVNIACHLHNYNHLAPPPCIFVPFITLFILVDCACPPYCLYITFIAELQSKASNLVALSLRMLYLYVYIIHINISVPVNPRHKPWLCNGFLLFSGTYNNYKLHFDGIHIFTIIGGYLLLDVLLAMALR